MKGAGFLKNQAVQGATSFARLPLAMSSKTLILAFAFHGSVKKRTHLGPLLNHQSPFHQLFP